jgi:3-methyl-2-oxobutanoate hydroxymethyltransferase
MLTPQEIKQKKINKQKVAMLTAYDFAFAQMAEKAGIDQILVGDSLANVMLGYKSTREIGMTEMCIFVSAVCRGAPNTHIVADMPYLSDKTPTTALENVKRLLDCGATSVKIEGRPLGVLELLRSHDIPVCAHLGLLPQTALDFKQKGKTEEDAKKILDDALFCDQLGCFEIVLEHIPESLGTLVTQRVTAITIGIGAGKNTDGQVLVMHDALGMHQRNLPPFATKFANIFDAAVAGMEEYIHSIR